MRLMIALVLAVMIVGSLLLWVPGFGQIEFASASIVTPRVLISYEGKQAAFKGYSPQALWSAYGLRPLEGKNPGTVAIVDAYHAPTLEADVATYRARYHLPPCTTASGCFLQVSERGDKHYPKVNKDWAVETSLDAEMVSALCPHCHIIVVEADAPSLMDLMISEQQAASYHPTAISNSWGSPETKPTKAAPCSPDAKLYGYCQTERDAMNELGLAFWYPGIVVTVSSGDDGYGASFPADSPYVIAVGGTSLRKDPSSPRGWKEVVWEGSGSGCSYYMNKPAWQNDRLCANRTISDVAFDADPYTGVAVYDSTPYYSHKHHKWMRGWIDVGGTSVGAPAIAAIYGLANNTRSMPRGAGAFLYEHSGDLFDVTHGTNAPNMRGYHKRLYLIEGRQGYDAPTGLGTPKGLGAF